VPVKTIKYVDAPKCYQVAKTDCQDVIKKVSEVECQPTKEDKCYKVPIQVQLMGLFYS
jgi:hypothetical protein